MQLKLKAFLLLAPSFGYAFAEGWSGMEPQLERIRPRQTTSKHFFVLGDSYSNIAFDPAGVLPSSGNPLGNRDMILKLPENGDLARGPNWVVDLTTAYNATEILTYDLAINCAVVNSSITVDICPFARDYDVQWQTDQLKQIARRRAYTYARLAADNTLVAYFIGLNDASVPTVNNRTGLEDMLTQATDELFFQHVEQVYDLGIRKFLFLTVPPYDRTPQVQSRQNATYTAAQQYARSVWNDFLNQKRDAWAQQHADAQAIIFETADIFNYVLDNPTQFGAHADGASCFGTLPDCLWADNFHPGPAFYDAIAKAVAAGVGGVFGDFFIP